MDILVASRVFGDQVGSTAPVFLAFLAVHVLAGITAVITGAIAALVCKGSPRHIRAGRGYYWAITVVFATATALAAMRWRQDYYLFLIGAVAFTAATIGYLHRRRHRSGDTGHIAGMGVAYVAMLTAFYVDNGPHLPLGDHLPVLAFWLLPSAISAPIITRAILHARPSSRDSGTGRTDRQPGQGHEALRPGRAPRARSGASPARPGVVASVSGPSTSTPSSWMRACRSRLLRVRLPWRWC